MLKDIQALKEIDKTQIFIAGIFITIIAHIAVFNLHKSSIQNLEKELIESKQYQAKYDSLKLKWSEKALKSALSKLEQQIKSLGMNQKTTKRKNYTKITFDIDRKNANILISKILNTNLLYKSLKITKKDDFSISVALEVVL